MQKTIKTQRSSKTLEKGSSKTQYFTRYSAKPALIIHKNMINSQNQDMLISKNNFLPQRQMREVPGLRLHPALVGG